MKNKQLILPLSIILVLMLVSKLYSQNDHSSCRKDQTSTHRVGLGFMPVSLFCYKKVLDTFNLLSHILKQAR
jgi:hypothetical protein